MARFYKINHKQRDEIKHLKKKRFPLHAVVQIQSDVYLETAADAFDRVAAPLPLTPLTRPTSGDGSGELDRPSIMFITVSGTLLMSQHFSCQVGSFRDNISLAWGKTHTHAQGSVLRRPTSGGRGAAFLFLSSPFHGSCLFGRRTCSVCQPGSRSASSPPAAPPCSHRQ